MIKYLSKYNLIWSFRSDCSSNDDIIKRDYM